MNNIVPMLYYAAEFLYTFACLHLRHNNNNNNNIKQTKFTHKKLHKKNPPHKRNVSKHAKENMYEKAFNWRRYTN